MRIRNQNAHGLGFYEWAAIQRPPDPTADSAANAEFVATAANGYETEAAVRQMDPTNIPTDAMGMARRNRNTNTVGLEGAAVAPVVAAVGADAGRPDDH